MIVICVGALPHAGPAQAADTQTKVRKDKRQQKRNRNRRARRARQKLAREKRAQERSGSTESAKPKTNKTNPSDRNRNRATDIYDAMDFEDLNRGHNLARLEDPDSSLTQVARELTRGSSLFGHRASPTGNSGFDRFGPNVKGDATDDPSRTLDPAMFAPLAWTADDAPSLSADGPDTKQGFDRLASAFPRDGPIIRALRGWPGRDLFGPNSTLLDNGHWPLQFQGTDTPAWELGTYNFDTDPTAEREAVYELLVERSLDLLEAARVKEVRRRAAAGGER